MLTSTVITEPPDFFGYGGIFMKRGGENQYGNSSKKRNRSGISG